MEPERFWRALTIDLFLFAGSFLTVWWLSRIFAMFLCSVDEPAIIDLLHQLYPCKSPCFTDDLRWGKCLVEYTGLNMCFNLKSEGTSHQGNIWLTLKWVELCLILRTDITQRHLERFETRTKNTMRFDCHPSASVHLIFFFNDSFP